MTDTLTAANAEQIDKATTELADVRASLAKARESLPILTRKAEAYDQGPVDPGMLSGTRRKPNPRADAKRFGRYDAESEAYAAVRDCQDTIHQLTAREERLVRTFPNPFTLEQLQQARAIRTESGWQKVTRINDKTVSIATGYSWSERIPFGKILDVHA